MQEFIIFLSLILALFFWVFGQITKNWGLFAIAAIFFFFIGAGILSTGWERFEGDATVTKVSSTVDTIDQTSTTYNATQSENVLLWGFGLITMALALGLAIQSAREYTLTKQAQEEE